MKQMKRVSQRTTWCSNQLEMNLMGGFVLWQTRYKTNEPVWEEAFSFLIHNPRTQDLEVEVHRKLPPPFRQPRETDATFMFSHLIRVVVFR